MRCPFSEGTQMTLTPYQRAWHSSSTPECGFSVSQLATIFFLHVLTLMRLERDSHPSTLRHDCPEVYIYHHSTPSCSLRDPVIQRQAILRVESPITAQPLIKKHRSSILDVTHHQLFHPSTAPVLTNSAPGTSSCLSQSHPSRLLESRCRTAMITALRSARE
jgi:hypothetical protein